MLTMVSTTGKIQVQIKQKPYSPTLRWHLYTKHLTNSFLSFGVFIAFKGTTFLYFYSHGLLDNYFILAIVSNADSQNYSFNNIFCCNN